MIRVIRRDLNKCPIFFGVWNKRILSGPKLESMDFTLNAYKELLRSFKTGNYTLLTFLDHLSSDCVRSVILRHDVDRLPENALRMAQIEAELGVKASYYFRMAPESFDRDIIKKIAEMGHEIGYHYENLSAVAGRKDFRKSQIPNSKSQKNTKDKSQTQNSKFKT